MQTGRPKLNVPRSATEKVVEVVALAGAAALVVVATGTSWILTLSMYVGLTLLSRYPHIYNYAVTITEQNAAAQYQNARSLITCLKAEMVWLFAYIEWQAFQRRALSIAFLPAVLLAVMLTLAIHIGRMIRLR